MMQAGIVAAVNGHPIEGVGLGLREPFLADFAKSVPDGVDFVEVTAEHWFRKRVENLGPLRAVLEQVPAICHALNSNFGGPAPLDELYLRDIKRFLDQFDIELFSDHLCHSADEDWMHNLMPIPFTDEAVAHTAAKIRRAREILERPVAIENISYLTAPGRRMPETEFIAAVVEEADCGLLLDVNNLYVNSRNNGYDAVAFLDALPDERIVYAHMAGHLKQVEPADENAGEDGAAEGPVLYLDSHGHPLADPVLRLLDAAYARFGVFPAMVERDQNFPPMPELLAELAAIREIQRQRRPVAAGAA